MPNTYEVVGTCDPDGTLRPYGTTAPKAEADAITAADVSYGDSDVDTALTELNSKITANAFGTAVSLPLDASEYVAPADGYVIISMVNTDTTNFIRIYLNDNVVYVGFGTGANGFVTGSSFVRKGMTIKLSGPSTGASAQFNPLT